MNEKNKEIDHLRKEIESLKEATRAESEKDRLNVKRERLHEQMYQSQHAEETTDMNILRRKADRVGKENELLKKQNQDLKSQVESLSSKMPSMYTSGYHDGDRLGSGSKSITIKKESNNSKETQMKDMEVVWHHRDQRAQAGEDLPPERAAEVQGASGPWRWSCEQPL